MNLERVVFGFVIILALAFTFAFVMGDIDNAAHNEAKVQGQCQQDKGTEKHFFNVHVAFLS